MNRPIAIARSLQTCALGSAVAAAVMAGKSTGGYDDFPTAIKYMTGVQDRVFMPDKHAAAIYQRLFAIYHRLHDAFGVARHKSDLSGVMKELLDIRDAARGERAESARGERSEAAHSESAQSAHSEGAQAVRGQHS
jgi:L-ribulokinase